jgi:hypothetical protein
VYPIGSNRQAGAAMIPRLADDIGHLNWEIA